MSQSSESLLSLQSIEAGYGATVILEQVSFELARGEIACLVGPSGSGKSTLLRCIAGFEPLRQGRITLGGRELSGARNHVRPDQRRVGLVFQDYALFPHLTVESNVGFGLARNKAAQLRVRELLAAVELETFAKRYPHELSGGQQQRVALARALAPKPEIVLLDEPFSNLDPNLRHAMRQEIKSLLKAFAMTAVLVTHDQEEAFDLADKLGVLDSGRLLQWAPPVQVHRQPTHPRVASFLGAGELLPFERRSDGDLATELGVIAARKAQPELETGKILVRPEDLRMAPSSSSGEIKARVEAAAFRGSYVIYTLALPSGRKLRCFVPGRDIEHAVGSEVGVGFQASELVLFA